MGPLLITLIAALIAYRVSFGTFKGVLIPLVILGLSILFISVPGAFLSLLLFGFGIPFAIAKWYIQTSDKNAGKFAGLTLGIAILLPFVLNAFFSVNFGISFIPWGI